MSQGGYVTLVGFVAREPNLREVKDGRHVTEVRVGTTSRVKDMETGEWRDADTSYYTVNCWRRLADNVRASLRKGDPVVVKGRFKTRSYEDKTGQLRTVVEITADTVGHDLSQGIANYIKHRSRQAPADGDPAGSQAGDRISEHAPENADLGEGPDDMIDEDAIERFGRDLDGADLAARALTDDRDARREDEDEDDEDIEDTPDAAASAVPATPY
jgi:single-strand DNA-binding protein